MIKSWLVIHWWLHEPQTLWMHHLSSDTLSIHSFHPSSIRDYHLPVCNRLNESPKTTPQHHYLTLQGLSLFSLSLSQICHALKWALTPLPVFVFFCFFGFSLCRGCFESYRQSRLMICFDVLEVIKFSLQSNDSFLVISLYQYFAAWHGKKVKIQNHSEEEDSKPRV